MISNQPHINDNVSNKLKRDLVLVLGYSEAILNTTKVNLVVEHANGKTSDKNFKTAIDAVETIHDSVDNLIKHFHLDIEE